MDTENRNGIERNMINLNYLIGLMIIIAFVIAFMFLGALVIHVTLDNWNKVSSFVRPKWKIVLNRLMSIFWIVIGIMLMSFGVLIGIGGIQLLN